MKGILFDQPLAVDGARPRIEAEAIAERCEIIGGDFFDAVPPPRRRCVHSQKYFA
jgi:hypothetical protein